MSRGRIVTPLVEQEKRQWERLIEKTLKPHDLLQNHFIQRFWKQLYQISVAIIFVPIIFVKILTIFLENSYSYISN